MSEILDNLHLYPPHCLEGLKPRPLAAGQQPEILREEDFSYFDLHCPCGEPSGTITGYTAAYSDPNATSHPGRIVWQQALRVLHEMLFWQREPGQSGLLGPLTFCCNACSKKSVLFNPVYDGACAELAHPKRVTQHEIPEDRAGKEMVRCPPCHSISMQLVAGIGYGLTPWKHHAASRPQDLFDTFQLFVHCATCGNSMQVSSISTASEPNLWLAKSKPPARWTALHSPRP